MSDAAVLSIPETPLGFAVKVLLLFAIVVGFVILVRNKLP
jgi:hypothetical protein